MSEELKKAGAGVDERAAVANDWFLSLPKERQAVLREDKWLLADAAFHAGQARAQLAAPAGVPDGWRLVPVDLDTAMLRAMMEQITKSPVTWCRYRAVYRAMLAAAPPPAPAYRSHTTTPGEAVAGIALRQLKDESRWVEIRDLNAHAFPDIGPHDYYPVGTVLRLPEPASDVVPVPRELLERIASNKDASYVIGHLQNELSALLNGGRNDQ